MFIPLKKQHSQRNEEKWWGHNIVVKSVVERPKGRGVVYVTQEY